MPYPRHLTQQEQAALLQGFPNADVSNIIALREATRNYNCLAWSLNITNAWVWPWNHSHVTRDEFDVLYTRYNRNPVERMGLRDGDVAAYGISENDMTHGAVRYRGTWTSKLGAGLLVSHTLHDLVGPNSIYGYVLRYYDYGVGADEPLGAARIEEDELDLEALSPLELSILAKKVKSVPDDVAVEFNRRYNAWRATWFDSSNLFFSSPETRTRSIEFERLIIMGPDIVPLLIDKLQYPDEFFALQALEIFVDTTLVHRPEIGHPDVLKGEQGRARTTVKKWLIGG